MSIFSKIFGQKSRSENKAEPKCTSCYQVFPESELDSDTGRCAACGARFERLQHEKEEFEAKLANGMIFVPSVTEKNSALDPSKCPSKLNWILQPDVYAGRGEDRPGKLLSELENSKEGYLFLARKEDVLDYLSLSYNQEWGVIDFAVQDQNIYAYAGTSKNADHQIDSDFQLMACCACCGVEMSVYPSRFHMPRAKAFDAFKKLISGRNVPDIAWLKPDGDISHTESGAG